MSFVMDSVPEIKSSSITEVAAGSTVTLRCASNDYNHNFMFWLLNQNNIIGPGNVYDTSKYKYEVLSGNLKIHHVTPAEAGHYRCVSKNISGTGLTVGEVEMIVDGTAFTALDAVKLVAIVVSIIVIIACGVIYFRLKREWNKYDGRAIVPVDDIEDDDGDEVYNRTTTTIPPVVPAPVAGPSRNVSSEHLLYGIDNQGLDTDFNSVFENIQIKTPQGSLI